MDYIYQGRHPPAQLAAMIAQSNSIYDEEQPRFANSGAKTHLIPNLENLTTPQLFQCDTTVIVGNGTRLHIKNSGSSTFQSSKSKIHLKNIINCLQAYANILSINFFLLDSYYYFLLTSSSYIVKDILTRTGAE